MSREDQRQGGRRPADERPVVQPSRGADPTAIGPSPAGAEIAPDGAVTSDLPDAARQDEGARPDGGGGS